MFFLTGESETTRINNIVSAGARDRLTDQQFLEHEIAEWKRSPRRKAQVTGERYYAGWHDILFRRQLAIGANGELEEVKNRPNYRVTDNQYAKMVDQKANYLLGKPITFETKNYVYANALKTVLGHRFFRTLRYLGEDALNGGIGWLMPRYSDDGELIFKRFESYEILPFWADAEHTRLDAAIRLYEVEAYEGATKKIEEHVEVYTPQGIYLYALDNGILIPEGEIFVPYAIATAKSYNWERLPIIPFKRNNKETPLIDSVKSLQDGINLITSNFQNDMSEDGRASIFVLVNYGGENLGEFRRNLAAYGAINIQNFPEMPNGDVKTIEVHVNADNYKAILDLFKRALIENARGYDVSELRASGTPNEMNIKSIYNDIDLDANMMETEFQASLEDLLWFINCYLCNTGVGDFTNEPVEIIFNRDTVVVESQVIQDIRNSVGIISNETLVAQHPYVADVKEELKRLENEKQQAMDDYAGAFPAAKGKESKEGGGDDVDA